jgi:hypothetical protein
MPLTSQLLGTSLHRIAVISVFIAALVFRKFDTTFLIYFAMSVFWRAGAHTWAFGGEEIHIELGPYEEPMRKFLLGEQGFPNDMALYVRVIADDLLLSTSRLPGSEKRNGVHLHDFSVPGINFDLFVGKQLSEGTNTVSTAPAQKHTRATMVFDAAESEAVNDPDRDERIMLQDLPPGTRCKTAIRLNQVE